MALFVAIIGVLVLLVALWLFGLRDTNSTQAMDALPDDLRRADDGRPDLPFSDYGNPAGPTGNR